MQVERLQEFLQRHLGAWPAHKYPDWSSLDRKAVHANFATSLANGKQLGAEEPVEGWVVDLAVARLQKNRVCVLEGLQGRGKTVCAITIGHRLAAKMDSVMLGQASRFEPEVALSTLDANRNVRILVILEDLHSSTIGLPDFLLEYAENYQNVNWLVTSRPTVMLNALKDSYPILSVAPTIEDAVTMFKLWAEGLRTLVTSNQRLEDARRDARGIVDRLYEGDKPPLNLRRLGHFFRIWNVRTDAALQLAEAVDKRFWDDLRQRPELKERDQREILLPVAALGLKEMKASEEFVSRFGSTNQREELERSGVLERHELPKRGVYYSVHPSDGEDYLNAALDGGMLGATTLRDYFLEQATQYIRTGPSNLDETLLVFRQNASDLLDELRNSDPLHNSEVRVATLGAAQFASVFAFAADVFPSRVLELYQTWVGSRDGSTPELRFKKVCLELVGAGSWPTYLILRALRKAEMHEQRSRLVRGLDWDRIASDLAAPGKGLATLTFVLGELKSYPEQAQAILPTHAVAMLLRRSTVNTIVRFFTLLRRQDLESVANQIIQTNGRTIAEKIREGHAPPMQLGFLLFYLKDVENFDWDLILPHLNAVRTSPHLSLASLGLLLRQLRRRRHEARPVDSRVWRSLVPSKETLTGLVQRAEAADLPNALSGLPLDEAFHVLQVAGQDWVGLLSRSSLNGVARLENNLRKRAKTIFELVGQRESAPKRLGKQPTPEDRDEDNRSKNNARLFQDYSSQIVHALNCMQWNRWPLDRIGVYRDLLLNAVSMDRIFWHRRQGGEPVAWEDCAPVTALRLAELDLGQSFRREVEFQEQQGRRDEALREWARFLWTLRWVDARSSIFENAGVRSLLGIEIARETNPPRLRLMFFGASHFLRPQPPERLDDTSVRQGVDALLDFLTKSHNEKAHIQELFLVLLEVRGAVDAVSPDSESGQILARLRGPMLERLLEPYDAKREKPYCDDLRQRIEALASKG